MIREHYKRVRKPLITKWGELSETDKKITREWLKNRGQPIVDSLPDDALFRGYEYMMSLKPSKNLKIDWTPQQQYDNSMGDKVFQMKHNTNAIDAFLSFLLTGVKPELKQTSFVESIADGIVEGSQILTKTALDPVGLGVEVVEGVVKEDVSFEALDKTEESVKDYDIKDIATDIVINVAVAAPVVKGAAKVVGKAVKK